LIGVVEFRKKFNLKLNGTLLNISYSIVSSRKKAGSAIAGSDLSCIEEHPACMVHKEVPAGTAFNPRGPGNPSAPDSGSGLPGSLKGGSAA
jgi:hypothetical protein